MRTIDCQQGTPEWLLARSGKVTASRIADVMNRLKDGSDGAGRRNYKAELVCERLTGVPTQNGFISNDMLRGIELEPVARAAYEIHYGVMVEQVGFVLHPTIQDAGASPDGCVGEDGIVEIKVPKLATHLGYVLKGEIPPEYRGQMVWQLACTGREWCDFVSYSPDMPERLQLFVKRMYAHPAGIQHAEDEVRQFLAEINGMLIQLGEIEAVAR